MGSDRDYSARTSDRSSRSSHNARFAQERMNAIRALDRAGRMTHEAAQRIQSHADKTGSNQDFKSRAMSAAEENEQ